MNQSLRLKNSLKSALKTRLLAARTRLCRARAYGCSAEAHVGVAWEHCVIGALPQLVCVQKAPESLIALRTENAVDAPQRCE